MGTFNSRLQKVQTPIAGVLLSHLTTLRRRWIMRIFSFVFGIPRCLGTVTADWHYQRITPILYTSRMGTVPSVIQADSI
jgi:hypothetical protein